MKRYEDFIEGLQQDAHIPDTVLSQYENTLANIEQLSQNRKAGGYDMRTKQRAKNKKLVRAAAAAGILVTCAGVFSYTNPAAASRIPIIGRIFDQVSSDLTYSGNYAQKEVLHNSAEKDSQTNADAACEPAGTAAEGIFTAADNGITITASEVYCDGYSIYLTAQIESEQGGFSNIPSYYTRRFGETTSQSLYTGGSWKTSGEAIALCNNNFEGKAVDDHTFIGMVKLDMDEYYEQNGVLHLSFSDFAYDNINALDAQDIGPSSKFDGTWELTVPFSVDKEQCKEIKINKQNENGYKLQSVFVSPYQVIVFHETPYTTLQSDSYTLEDFEKQWGKKNEEITAKGGEAVTYEEMLNKKYYETCSTAIFNQDGEALEFREGGVTKSIFAVQGHTLSKLHIYMGDDANDPDLLDAETEQEAKKLSFLDAEINL